MSLWDAGSTLERLVGQMQRGQRCQQQGSEDTDGANHVAERQWIL
jgi:hypothetical protein